MESGLIEDVSGVADWERRFKLGEFAGAPYHIKYRPKRLEDVRGHDDVVASLETLRRNKAAQHTFFFFGPGGTGKTTLARIEAIARGVEPHNIIEVDAASNSGIDDMRLLTAGARYSGFGDSPNKAYIIDECQGLSKSAWSSLLITTEDPPSHVFFFFCSTDPGKVPPAMLTRGPNYQLHPLRFEPLMDLLEDVADREHLSTHTPVLETVARAAKGSPRQALVMLAMTQDCKTQEDAEFLLEGHGEQKEVIDLCRAMVKGGLRWEQVTALLRPMADLGAEGIRIQVVLYLSVVLMNAKERDAPRLLDMVAAFSKPCNPTDKLAPILHAFGEFVDFGKR